MTKSILFSYTDYPHLIRALQVRGVKFANEALHRHGSFTFDLQAIKSSDTESPALASKASAT